MKNYLAVIASLLLFATPFISSCSKGQEPKEKGGIAQQTEKIGQEAANMIKTPLDEATKAAEQAQGHGQQLDTQLEKHE